MMENFAYEPAILKKFSKHWSYLSDEYKIAWQKTQNDSNSVQPPEKLPDDLIDDIRRVRNAYSVNSELHQVFLAEFDFSIHELKSHDDAAKLDTTKLYNTLYKNITGIEGPEVFDGNFHWGHFVSIHVRSLHTSLLTIAVSQESTFRHLMGGYQGSYYSYHWSRVYCKDLFYTAFKKDPFSSEAGGRFRKIVLVSIPSPMSLRNRRPFADSSTRSPVVQRTSWRS